MYNEVNLNLQLNSDLIHTARNLKWWTKTAIFHVNITRFIIYHLDGSYV